jgi:tRNA(fMet)-specific endonuclease VapC
MKGYLLDTCICVFLLRQKYGISEILSKINLKDIYISEVTVAELKFGAYRSAKPKENIKLIEKLCQSLNIVPFGETTDFYAAEKSRLYSLGTPIDDFDLLIASAAKVRNLKLITDNMKHFERIKGISVENWIER